MSSRQGDRELVREREIESWLETARQRASERQGDREQAKDRETESKRKTEG